MPRAASVLMGPAEMALTRICLGAKRCRQVAHAGLQRGFGHAHHVVAQHHFLGTDIAQGDDAAAFGHQRRGAARQRDQRIHADVMGDAEALAAGEQEVVLEILGRSKGNRVNQRMNLAVVALADLLEDPGDLLVLAHVALEALRSGQAGDHGFGFLTKPLVLVCDCYLRAGGVKLLGNGPGNTALVGQAEDYGDAPIEGIWHLTLLPNCELHWSVLKG